jgi:AraC-like DNA-binding protein
LQQTIGARQKVLAAMLPPPSAARLREVLPDYQVVTAEHSAHADNLLSTAQVDAFIFDPCSNVGITIDDARRLLWRHSGTAAIAYVLPTSRSLLAIFSLSKCGLEHVFVHPLRLSDLELITAIRRSTHDRSAVGMQVNSAKTMFSAKLRGLPHAMQATVLDVLHRPNGYQTTIEIARRARLSLKGLHRCLAACDAGTPKKLLMFAKMLQAYEQLRETDDATTTISERLGYTDPKVFRTHVVKVFGCSAKEVRSATNSEELYFHLIEWQAKPALFERAFHRSRSGAMNSGEETQPGARNGTS